MAKVKQKHTEQMKTVGVIGAFNILMAPLYWVNERLGLTTALVVNGLFITWLHNKGEQDRPAANMTINGSSNVLGIFGQKSNAIENAKVENIGNNINHGGAQVFDQVTSWFKR